MESHDRDTAIASDVCRRELGVVQRTCRTQAAGTDTAVCQLFYLYLCLKMYLRRSVSRLATRR